jgi:hypothetical protein
VRREKPSTCSPTNQKSSTRRGRLVTPEATEFGASEVTATEAVEAPTPRRRGRKIALIVGGVLTAFVLVGGIASAMGGGTSSTHKVTGTMAVWDADSYVDSGDCFTSSGYDDIHEGTQVTVSDHSGKVIAITELDDSFGKDGDGLCMWSFKVDVPSSDFYKFEVSHRGVLVYSASEMDENKWEVDFTLGDPSDVSDSYSDY